MLQYFQRLTSQKNFCMPCVPTMYVLNEEPGEQKGVSAFLALMRFWFDSRWRSRQLSLLLDLCMVWAFCSSLFLLGTFQKPVALNTNSILNLKATRRGVPLFILIYSTLHILDENTENTANQNTGKPMCI